MGAGGEVFHGLGTGIQNKNEDDDEMKLECVLVCLMRRNWILHKGSSRKRNKFLS